MAWFDLVLPAVLILVILILPGMAVGKTLRLSWKMTATVAPLLGIAWIAASAVIAGQFHIFWGPKLFFWWTVGLLVICASVTVALNRLNGSWLSKRETQTKVPVHWGRLTLFVATGLASAIVSAWAYVTHVELPSNWGQYQDTMFHFNLVKYEIETGDASSLHAGQMDGSIDGNGFYPSAWHNVINLISQITGLGLPEAANAFTLVLLCVLWPLSVAALVSYFLPRTSRLAAATAAFAVANLGGAFPWRFLTWGVLYSNFLGMSVMLLFVLLYLQTLETLGRRTWPRLSSNFSALFVGFIGLVFAQPNTIFSLVVMLVPATLAWIWCARPNIWSSWTTRLWASLIFLVVVAMAWIGIYRAPFMQRTVRWEWPATSDFQVEFSNGLVGGFNEAPIDLLLAALAACGLIWIIRYRRQLLWLLASFVYVTWCYALAAGTDGRLKNLLTGFWYHDAFRLAAVAQVMITLLAGIGIWYLGTLLAQQISRRGVQVHEYLTTLLVGGIVGALAWSGAPMKHQLAEVRKLYTSSYITSPQEVAFLRQVAAIVPQGDVIANSPYDGSSLGYAFDNLSMLFPAMDGNWMGVWDPDKRLISEHLRDAETMPSVCEAIRSNRVKYVVTLPEHDYSDGANDPVWRGLRNIGDAPGFEEVLSDGTNKLWRVTACS